VKKQKNSIERKVKSLPTAPGVYLFKDSRGRVIYVGKAGNLRSRVSSYFHSGERDPKTEALVTAVRRLEHIETDSDIEALLLESRLIKEYDPKYNSDLKDDKSYPLIAISREPFPRVTITRDRNRDSVYIGPFIGASDLKHALPVLQRIFKFRTCALSVNPDSKRWRRPCLLYYIDRCSGPCAGKVTKKDYAVQIKHLRQFLRGGKRSLVARLSRQMEKEAKELEFERAAAIRDQIQAIEHVHHLAQMESLREELVHPDVGQGLKLLRDRLGLKRLPRLIDGIDAAAISGKEAVGSAIVFADGEPHKASYRHYKIKSACTLDDPAMIGEVVLRRYRRRIRDNGPMPHLILVDGGMTQLRSARIALENAGGLKKVEAVISLAKREEKVFRAEGSPLLLKRTSPALKILQHVRDEAHRFAQRYHHILRRKKVLGK
jgi:excinuclease ABC subunit C